MLKPVRAVTNAMRRRTTAAPGPPHRTNKVRVLPPCGPRAVQALTSEPVPALNLSRRPSREQHTMHTLPRPAPGEWLRCVLSHPCTPFTFLSWC